MLAISAPDVLLDGAFAGPRTVIVDGDRIAAVLERAPEGLDEHVALSSGVLSPGLIDLHVNGAFGVDFAATAESEWTPVLRALAARGVTSVQPTFITAPLDELRTAASRCAAAERDRPADAARVLGAHLEGPFLAATHKGAHRAELLLEPTEAHVKHLLGERPPLTVTLAPELVGASSAIERLSAEGVVVAVGHTDATAAQIHEAADAGATLVTHLYNAQRRLGHREPGVPGAALTSPRLLVCVITDGIHVHPDVVKLSFAAARNRMIAVTDSILIAGLPAGAHLEFGEQPVSNERDGAGRRPDGTLAGAGIVLDEGVRRMVKAGIDAATVLHAATTTPARAIARADLGRIEPGAHADLVQWDTDLRPRRVWLGGREIATR